MLGRPGNAGRFGLNQVWIRDVTSLVALLCILVVSGCAPQDYFRRADRETRRVLFGKVRGVENVDAESVSIDVPEPISLEKLTAGGEASEFLGKLADAEVGARVLPLADALEMAIKYNRTYLTRKEVIYLQALDLTLARWEFGPIFQADAGELWESDSRDADRTFLAETVNDRVQVRNTEVDGTVTTVTTTTDVVEKKVYKEVDTLLATQTFNRDHHFGFSKLTKTGARLTADFTSDFLTFMLGGREVNNSKLALTAVQPLLKGGGLKATTEALTQAERNLLYTLRDFANYRREFIVGVAADYYGILRARDTVRNNWIAYQGFLKSVEQGEALAEEGRRTQTELGRLRQALLRAETDWVNAVRDYRQQLDEFKIQLGMSIDENIVLEEQELEKLEIIDPELTREQAVEVALASRPDLVTATDRVKDAERLIEVAKVDLLPGLDVTGAYDALSDPGDVTPNIRYDRRRWSAAVELDLPLDRKAERNFYRSTLIQLEQARREDILARDNVKLDVYNGWRTLEQARKNYEIAVLGVELAERRLEEQVLRAELGGGDAQDLVDAQQDLVQAQNQRTSALVAHTLARLRLWQNMGILYINNDGSWIKKLEEEGNDHD